MKFEIIKAKDLQTRLINKFGQQYADQINKFSHIVEAQGEEDQYFLGLVFSAIKPDMDISDIMGGDGLPTPLFSKRIEDKKQEFQIYMSNLKEEEEGRLEFKNPYSRIAVDNVDEKKQLKDIDYGKPLKSGDLRLIARNFNYWLVNSTDEERKSAIESVANGDKAKEEALTSAFNLRIKAEQGMRFNTREDACAYIESQKLLESSGSFTIIEGDIGPRENKENLKSNSQSIIVVVHDDQGDCDKIRTSTELEISMVDEQFGENINITSINLESLDASLIKAFEEAARTREISEKEQNEGIEVPKNQVATVGESVDPKAIEIAIDGMFVNAVDYAEMPKNKGILLITYNVSS